MSRVLHRTAFLLLVLFAVWSTAAIYFDCRIVWLKLPLAAVHLLAFVAALWRYSLVPAAFIEVVVLGWWLSLTPSNVADWQPDVSRMPEARVDGDRLTIQNVRNCHYRSERDYTCDWEKREYSLAAVRYVDFFLIHWGAPLIAHVIVSFEFADGRHLAFSIEARKQVGQEYSAALRLFSSIRLALSGR